MERFYSCSGRIDRVRFQSISSPTLDSLLKVEPAVSKAPEASLCAELAHSRLTPSRASPIPAPLRQANQLDRLFVSSPLTLLLLLLHLQLCDLFDEVPASGPCHSLSYDQSLLTDVPTIVTPSSINAYVAFWWICLSSSAVFMSFQ